MLETLKTTSILICGVTDVIFLITLLVIGLKKIIKHCKSTKGDRDLKKLKKLQAKCGGKQNG